MTTLTDIGDASELVAHALRPGRAAAASDAYATLRTRYREDPAFAEVVDTVAGGLGLRVLGLVPGRLVVTPTEASVFAGRTGDYADTSMSVEQRMLHGLAQLAVAAYCYPSPQSLTDPRTITVDPAKVAAELTETAVRVAADHDDDLAAGDDGLREAWRAWLALAEVSRTQATRRLIKGGSRLWYAQQTCRWLAEQGLLTAAADGTTFHTTEAYQLHVRDIAADVRFQLVRDAAPCGDDTGEPITEGEESP